MTIVESINILGEFCGTRDVEALTQEHLRRTYGFPQADVFVLFGGSILCGGDVLAEAMEHRVAKRFLIVGGEGHTTETLRVKMHAAYPAIETHALPEAEVFHAYLQYRYGKTVDHLECRSTNCGNNITNLLDLLEKERIPCSSIILTQDATMQRRMDAGLRKHRSDMQIINFAAYKATVAEENGVLSFAGSIRGMWDMLRYINLLLGEISRLKDDENGYGPRGKGFIAHVEIPAQVLRAFETLQNAFPSMVREADPAYAG